MSTQLHPVLCYLRRLPPGAVIDGPADGDLLTRFVARRDEAAFAALVERHGPMVLGVCRRILRDEHDAEDAFQATFLVLARKAGTLRGPGSLAGWLYSVACRTARHARAALSRRRARERRLTDVAAADPAPGAASRDLRPVLDEELLRLPDRYRRPLVLCYLQGMTYDEAAGLLRWPKGTVATRLARARELLRGRLARRGLTLSAAALVAAASAARGETVPASLAASAVRTALAGAAGPVAGSGSPFALADGVLRALGLNKLRTPAAVVLILALGVGAGALAYRAWGSPRPDREAPAGGRGGAADVRADAHGDPLPPGALARLGTVRLRHDDWQVDAVAFSPDGKVLASGGHDATARLWDRATGKELRRLAGHKGQVSGVAFAPDGKALATGDADGLVRLWDPATGVRLWEGNEQMASVLSLAFSPDGRTVASGHAQQGSDCPVCLWDGATGKKLRRLKGHRPQQDAYPVGVFALAFSPDGKTLASGSDDKAVRLWDVATGKEVRRLEGHDSPVASVSFSPDGALLATAGRKEAEVRLWDPQTGREVRRLGPHEAGVTCVGFTPDGKALACGVGPGEKPADGGVVHLWDPATGKALRRLTGTQTDVSCLAFSPDGKALASGSAGDPTVRIWDVASGKEVRPADGHDGPVLRALFLPDGKTLLSGGADGTFRLWDAATGRPLREVARHPSLAGPPLAGATALDPGGRTVASVTAPSPREKSVLRISDVATGKELHRLTEDGQDFRLAYSPDGKTLAVAGFPTLALWDVDTGKRLRELGKGGGPLPEVDSLAFSPDGRVVAAGAGAKGGAVYLWEAATGTELRRCEGYGGEYRALAFSADGRMLAGTGPENTVRLWEVATGQERLRIRGGQAKSKAPLQVCSLAFSPDGGLLAGGIRDGFMRSFAGGSGAYLGPADPDPVGFDLGKGRWTGALSWFGLTKPSTLPSESVMLWDTASGVELRELRWHGGWSDWGVAALSFRPDGQALASGSSSAVLIWDLAGLRQTTPAPRLSSRELQALWEDLASAEGPRSYRALTALAEAPGQAAPFLAGRLRPVPGDAPPELARLLADLDDDRPAVREKATRELEGLGPYAEAALRGVLAGEPSAEVRRRVRGLLEKLDPTAPRPEVLRVLRAMEALERAATPEARRLLKDLAGGAPGAWLTEEAAAAVDRLGRRAGAP